MAQPQMAPSTRKTYSGDGRRRRRARAGLRHAAASSFALFTLVAASHRTVAACNGGQPATQRFAARMAALQACVGLAGAGRLTVRFEATRPCPTSGQRCCLANDRDMHCSDGSGQLCGAAGRFDPNCLLIRLPDECDAALEHEAIHGLLYLNGFDDWADHTHPAFHCEPGALARHEQPQGHAAVPSTAQPGSLTK